MKNSTTFKKSLFSLLFDYQVIGSYSDRRKIGSRLKIATVKHVDDEQLSKIKSLSNNIISIDRMTINKGRQSNFYWFTIKLDCMQSEAVLNS